MHKPIDLWKTLKKVLPQPNGENTTLFCDDDGEHITPISIANCYNNGSKLATAFPSGLQIVNSYPNVNTTFSFQEIPVDFTLKQLHLLKSGKSTGLDDINSCLLKDSAEVVSIPLTAIMNASLTTVELPNIWKKSKITSVYKAENPLNHSNYRPISILPVSMKIFERPVHIQLNSYLNRIGVLSEEPSAFRDSIITAVTDVTDFIYKNMDQDQLTGAVFLDLKKVFDTVDEETLLFNL